ncbi:polyphosphate kinase 1 [Sesbania bispinosa]|nr:polyphosphate kinase 1 [Sesbania bispinosa]
MEKFQIHSSVSSVTIVRSPLFYRQWRLVCLASRKRYQISWSHCASECAPNTATQGRTTTSFCRATTFNLKAHRVAAFSTLLHHPVNPPLHESWPPP